MKNLIIKILLFSILVLSVIYVSEKFFIKEGMFNYNKYTFDEISGENTLDILFFGSSKGYCSYNPAVFQNKLKANSFNLSGQGQVLQVTEFVLEETLKKTTPKLVVIDVSYNMIVFSNIDSISDSKKSYQFSILDNYELSVNKLNTLFDIYGTKDVIYASSPLIRNHDHWRFINKKHYKQNYFADKNNIFLGNNGYLGTIQELSKEGQEMAKSLTKDYNSLVSERNIQLKPAEVEVLERIESLVKAAGAELLFVSAPSIKGYSRHLSFYKNLEDYFDSKNIKYLNFNKLFSNIDIGLNDFKDSQHLNYSGGYKTSKHLAEYMRDTFRLEESEPVLLLNNNISYHLLNEMSEVIPVLKRPFNFNEYIKVERIGYFEETIGNFIILIKLDPKVLQSKTDYRGYIRYYNGEKIEQNKKVTSFPLKIINIEGDIYTFARVSVKDTDISKLDVFFIEKGTNKVSKTFSTQDLKLKHGIR